MKRSRVIWLTGTNTGVGKTFLAAEIAKVLSRTDLNYRVLKPFCSGGWEDVEILGAVQGLGQKDWKQINLYSFQASLAPALAAELEGIETCLETSVSWIKQRLIGQDLVVIEGAGGLLAPLGYNWTLIDLMRNIPGDIWIVAINKLGVLNSLFLTINELRRIFCEKELSEGGQFEEGRRIMVFLMNPPDFEKDQASECNTDLFSRFEPTTEAVCVNFFDPYMTNREMFMDLFQNCLKKHLSVSGKSLD